LAVVVDFIVGPADNCFGDMKSFYRNIICVLVFLGCYVSAFGASTPLFWKAEKEGKTIYLMGTIHIGSDDLYPLPDVVYDAMEESQTLFVEVDLRGLDKAALGETISSLSFMPDASLFDLLDSDTWFALDKVLDKYQLQLIQLDHLQPWYFVYLLSGLPAARGDYDPELGVDLYLMDLADREDVSVVSLETLDFQLKMFSDWSLEDQIELLEGSLTEDDVSMDSLTALHDAWKDGDEAAIISQEEASEGASEIMDAFWTKLIDERNHSMLESILKEMKTLDTAFVAVGAMHMVGDHGLAALLREDGFTVALLSGNTGEVTHD